MDIIQTDFEGLFVLKPKKYQDNRGWFSEIYNRNHLKKNGIFEDFIQDNHSFSKNKYTFRGFHLQREPQDQAKLVRCLRGSILDIVIDLRSESKTFKNIFTIELSYINNIMILIPSGFAHGFLTLEDNVEVYYKVDKDYSPNHEVTILYTDVKIPIDWPEDKMTISTKDRNGISLETYLTSLTDKGV
jgi:dTDP-4-dehydrorhamnose 3,5-epimerase